MDRGSQLSKDDEDDEDDEEDEEDEEEEERRTRQEEAEEEEEKEKEEEATDIKSNNPHLAGGELYNLYNKIILYIFFLCLKSKLKYIRNINVYLYGVGAAANC